ncbi:hypothetical protein L6452_05441 [Arctium lappa]|uniref:Uncharacterized protein n=1 Tax=Arctium lappa TaxID=4217 RepID=A0ACB9EGD8_ARCLA|nr:hypothetical protein L6452_05441 [Arctium lappa]
MMKEERIKEKSIVNSSEAGPDQEVDKNVGPGIRGMDFGNGPKEKGVGRIPSSDSRLSTTSPTSGGKKRNSDTDRLQRNKGQEASMKVKGGSSNSQELDRIRDSYREGRSWETGEANSGARKAEPGSWERPNPGAKEVEIWETMRSTPGVGKTRTRKSRQGKFGLCFGQGRLEVSFDVLSRIGGFITFESTS